ncbi:polyketide synthase [Fusarium heterosporum]|uniref:Polyketide synthase n=1 Tax=Fusarium heterosporum TaxID=42747 RepID=A0A8H5TVY9_FUSHE|nr:polyketide synthase [Fusarium heterosporum]
MSYSNVYVFGDQSTPVVGNLQALLRVKHNVLLQAFLQEAFTCIQRETEALPATDKSSIPRAESLSLLVVEVKRGATHAAIESCFLCIYEIGYYLEHLAHSKLNPASSPKCRFLGICTGGLAATAISCSQNVFDIPQLGAQAVTVALRQGVYIQRRAEHLGFSTPISWSVVIPARDKEQILEILSTLSRNKILPTGLQPYISAVSPGSVTISGSPSLLEALKSQPEISVKRAFSAPIYGPYHCHSALLSEDLEQITHDLLRDLDFSDNEALIPVVSCATGSYESKSTFATLLSQVLEDALAEQIRMDHVIDGLFEHASANDTTFIPINAQASTVSIVECLSRKGATARISSPSKSPTATPKFPRPESIDADKIAIVGFSGRFPEADDLDEFWDLLIRGLDVHKLVPEDRFAKDHFDPTGQRKNTSQVQYGCWLKTAGYFDTQFFHMSPKEALQTDPAQRLALLTAYEALEMSGFVPDRTPSTKRSRVGVYYGVTSNDWGEVNSAQDIDTYFIPGANRAFIPGRVNYFFKFTGPSIAVDTACSSSLAAINIAITSLTNRDCDTAIAGGTNVLTNPDFFAGLDRGHFLSRTGNCKTFDDDADGYCRADGIGTLVLKRLPDAISDGDPIFGTILGAYTNHSAESVSITRPLTEAQEYLFKKLLDQSGIHPHDVSYVEMHGTGTQAGDAVEMRSVLNTFAHDHSRSRDKMLHLGSIKSNIGHAESASGVIAIIKVLLMMQNNTTPPHRGIKNKINQGFPKDLGLRGVHIAQKGPKEWHRPFNGKRKVLINNFSAAGGNTSLLLEDGPTSPGPQTSQTKDPRTEHIVLISGRSTKALEENLKALEAFIANSELPEHELLSQLSYTTTARRMHHSRRVALVASNLTNLMLSISSAASSAVNVKAIPATVPKVGFLFTGQGAQETAMANSYYKRFSSFRADIQAFDAITKQQGLPSILPLISGTTPVEELSAVVVQLGTCIIQMALARFWISLGVNPQYVIGHSLGEYAALQIAGIISISDTIYLCGHRARLLEQKCTAYTHGMIAVKASADTLRRLEISGLGAKIACLNGVEDTVLSGPIANIDLLCGKLQRAGYKHQKLDIPFAFHSSQVEPILDELQDLASHVEFREPKLTMISTLTGKIVTADTMGPQYITRHCRETVNFLGAIQAAETAGIINTAGICIEIGAHPILRPKVKSIIGQDLRCYASLRRGEDMFKTLADSVCGLYLAGQPINWDEYHRDFKASHKVLSLPRYSWQLSNYWMPYKHSWCLTKGDNPSRHGTLGIEARRPVRLSDSIHDVVEQALDDKKSSIVAESDLHDAALLTVVKNHKVNGLTMAPSTLFTDMAFTLAKHLISHRWPETQTLMPAVNDMIVEKALILNGNNSQPFRSSLEVDWTVMRGNFKIYSVDETGKETTHHATCTVEIKDPEIYLQEWRSKLYLIQRSISQLQSGIADGSIHTLQQGMLYKLFSTSVQYGSVYQGIQQVCFDSNGLEGTAKVFLPSSKDTFMLNPYCCDSLGHLTGFIMNCSDSLDLAEHVYVNHGWRYLRMTEPYQSDVHYQTYVKMQAVGSDDSTYTGDVHILRDGNIISVCGGVMFKKISRRVLDMLLPRPSSANTKPTVSKIPLEKRALLTPPKSPGTAPASPPERMQSTTSAPLGFIQKVLGILADEIGVEATHLADSTPLADLGVDSLMSLTILGNFREELDLDIPAAQLHECITVKDFKDFILDFAGITEEVVPSSASDTESSSSTPASTIPSPDGKDLVDTNDSLLCQRTKPSVPRSTSTILQGTKHCSKTLFLFPDGAGSGTSYVTLPSISPDLRVIGLNSPYLTKPHEFTCPLQDITGSYLDEVRRRQPDGPYYFAGWSAGGVSAFEAARQLVATGERVEKLLLIDSPNPVGLGKLPKRMYDFLTESGTFGGFDMGDEAQSPPDWLFQHFSVFIEALDKYVPQPFELGSAPRTTLIWAKDGVCKNPHDKRPEELVDDPRGMKWLLNNRTDLGPNGWDNLVGADNIRIRTIEDANHFTLLREPVVSSLCGMIREALDIR